MLRGLRHQKVVPSTGGIGESGPGRPVSVNRPSRPRHRKAGCMPGRKRRLGENGCQSFGSPMGHG